jgi:hypothetical protein
MSLYSSPGHGPSPAVELHTQGAPEATSEVWQAVVEVREKPGAPTGVEFVPVSVKRKHAFTSTLTLSPGAVAALMQRGPPVPTGYDSEDLGVARSSARGE